MNRPSFGLVLLLFFGVASAPASGARRPDAGPGGLPSPRSSSPLPAPSSPTTLSGPSLWHIVDSSVPSEQRPAIIGGSQSLWCGEYDPCWVDSLGYPNFGYEILYIYTGQHSADYTLTLDMNLSSEQFYDYVNLVGGGGDALDPLGNDRSALDQVISGGVVGNAKLLVSWTGSITSGTPGATSINTTAGPVTINGANAGQPNTIHTSILINQHHKALYLVFRSDCLYSPMDGLWAYGTGMVLDNLATNDNGVLYTDGPPAGGTDSYGGVILVSVSGVPVITSRAAAFGNIYPTLAIPPSLTKTEGQSLNLAATASDPDAGNVVQITASGYPSGATFSASNGNPASASITGFLGAGSSAQSPYRIKWCATDGATLAGTVGGLTVLTVLSGTDALPSISAPASLTSNEGYAVTINASATDPDASNTLTITQSGKPASLAFTTSSGPSPRSARISGTLDCADASASPTVYNILWTVSDGVGGEASTTTALSVNNVLETPQFTGPAEVTHPVQSFIEVDMSVVSCMGINSLTADFSALPPGNNAKFSPGGTVAGPNTRGVFTWTPTSSDVGNYPVAFTAVNGFATASVTCTIHVTQLTTGVETGGDVSARFELEQNRPNPFNPETSIRFWTPREGPVHLAIFDLQGRHVATLRQGVMGSGPHEVRWNGRDVRGRTLPSGVYVYRIDAAGLVSSRRMVMLR